jgi:cytochrome P450
MQTNEQGETVLVQPSQFAFPQFNAGFRLCLGRSMAIMEAKVVVVAVLRRFKLTQKSNHEASYRMSIVLAMKHGNPMSIRDRVE